MQHSPSSQPSPTPPSVTPPKKSAQQVIGMIVGVICVVAAGAYLVNSLLLGNNSAQKPGDSTTTAPQGDNDEKLRQANTVTATSMAKLNAPCQVGAVANAAEFTKPYKVAAFSITSNKKTWSNVALDRKADYTAVNLPL